MRKEEARRLVRLIVRGEGSVRTSRHCRERMILRQVTMSDLLQVLLWGEVRDLRVDEERGDWRCALAGADLDGEELTVQVAILHEESAVVCITVY